jgi:hypothetical protein
MRTLAAGLTGRLMESGDWPLVSLGCQDRRS